MLAPQSPWHTQPILAAYDRLPVHLRDAWAWWGLPQRMARRPELAAQIEDEPTGTSWHNTAETRKLISAITPANLDKLHHAKTIGRQIVGTIHKRTRPVGKKAAIEPFMACRSGSIR